MTETKDAIKISSYLFSLEVFLDSMLVNKRRKQRSLWTL